MSALKDAMERKGMTPEELALDCGISLKLVMILRSGGVTHPDIAERIAQVMELTGDERNALVAKKHREALSPEEGRRPWRSLPFSKKRMRELAEKKRKKAQEATMYDRIDL